MKKLFIPLSLLVVAFALFMGQKSDYAVDDRKWNIDPRMTGIQQSEEDGISTPVIINENFPRTFTTPQIHNTPAGLMVVNTNVRVHPSTTTQSEVPITRHPTNESILFASSNAARMSGSSLSFLSEGCYVSTNGGATWFGSDTTNAAPLSNHGGDPAPAIDGNGRFHQSYLGYTTSGMFASYSTNNGVNWANTVTITSGSQDKNHTFVNDVSASPYYNRVYVTWSLFTASAPPCVVSYSTNGGVTYSSVVNVHTVASGHYAQGVNGATMPNGDAIICWQSPITSSPYTGDFVGFAKSTNGGANWTYNNNIFDCNGIRGTLSNKAGIRVNDFPWMGVDRTSGPRAGWIYIVTAEKNLSPAGSDPDIILHRSTDGGTTWSAGVRVNQDALNNGKTQYMPALRVDEFGGVNVVYYDDRNTSTDSSEVYVSRSIDGGTSWTDVLVSDHRFKPKPISGLAGGYQGDYIGITSGNNKVYPYWADDKVGLYQAWITTIDLGPAINHTPLGNTESTSGVRAVLSTIIPAGSNIDPTKTKLYYTKTTAFTDSVLMTNTGGNNWSANLTLSGAGTYKYYLKTVDLLGRVATSPSGAPGLFHSFVATPDTVKPVIVHTPIGNTPKGQWPANVSATVTDNIGIDSVWVRWYKNNTSTGVKTKKLALSGGNLYSGLFNSDTSQVAINDSIFYRIVAQDAGSNHKKDSTALYKFKIILLTNYCVGAGGSTAGWPFYTFYMDSRTQMLYLGSEITAAGGSAGNIMKIGFDVTSAASQVMNGFKVRIKNTTATTISSFDASGFTTVFDGSYTVPGTGIQYITLQNPYYWNGSSNIVIEICFNNSSYTSNTSVVSTPSSGRNVHNHIDLSTGDGCTGITSAGSTYTDLPKLCLEVTPATGTELIGTTVPETYSLSQNYPNPFNPTTKINFAIPKQGFVNLKVYDILGRVVKNLISEVKAAGYYSVDFNASELSSGVYFYKVDVNGFTDVKRMVLVK